MSTTDVITRTIKYPAHHSGFGPFVVTYDGDIAHVSVDQQWPGEHIGAAMSLELSEIGAQRIAESVDDPDLWWTFTAWSVWCRATEVDRVVDALHSLTLGFDWDTRRLIEEWHGELRDTPWRERKAS